MFTAKGDVIVKNEKRLSKTAVALICIMTVITACFALMGCGDSNKRKTDYVLSYMSTESEVYSSTAEVVKEVADTVVEIRTESVTTQWGKQYIVSGAGSGVILGNSGGAYFIITNNHVIEGAKDISVTTRAGVSYNAELIATDDSADIAVIKIKTSDELKVATWGNSDSLQIGEDLIAIGNPLGSLGGTVTKGILSATGRTINVGNYAMTLLQTDTAINPGNSGGGLFNMRGELIGVVNAKTADEEIEGICFAIPANIARAAYTDLLEHGYIVGRATLNIELAEGTITSGINTGSQTIAYVNNVISAPADTFKQYDRLYSLNGKKINSILDYNSFMATVNPGDSIKVEVYRGTVKQSYFNNSISFDDKITSFTVTASQYGA